MFAMCDRTINFNFNTKWNTEHACLAFMLFQNLVFGDVPVSTKCGLEFF